MSTYTYFAFISYAHKDEKHAAWLQKRLENYRIPVKLRKTHGASLPEHVRPVFRDKTDLRPGNLEKSLASELDDSKYLIVICSPAAKDSSWVNREIEQFRKSATTDNIIPVIVDCPTGTSVTDCYPEALDKNVLGISLAEIGKTKTVLHVLSRVLDIRFDSLYERHKKAQNRKSLLLAVLSLILLFVLSIQPKEYFEISQQQAALTNTVAVADHIVSSLEASDSPILKERTRTLYSTWTDDGKSENSVTWPIEQRRKNSKFLTADIRKELEIPFVTAHLMPGGKEAFREQLSLLSNQNDSLSRSILNSIENVIQKKNNALDELREIDESRTLSDARRHLGYFKSDIEFMRLYSMTLFWQLHQTLKPLDEEGHPEARQARAQAVSIPFDRQTVTNKLKESLNRKEALVGNAKNELQTKKQQLKAAYDKLRVKCTPLPEDPPELVWGKMVRLLTMGLVPEGLSNLGHYEKMMTRKGENPTAYTSAARMFIKNNLHKTHEGGVVIFGFEGNRPHSTLKAGDIITAINGQTVTLADEYIALRKRISGHPALTILRYDAQTKAFEELSVTSSSDDPRIGMLDLVEKL